MSNPFLTIEQVADYIGVSPKTIMSWTSKKNLPAYKFIGVTRYRLEDVDDFLSQYRTTTKGDK
jgi:excisionase family DNA binding protein